MKIQNNTYIDEDGERCVLVIVEHATEFDYMCTNVEREISSAVGESVEFAERASTNVWTGSAYETTFVEA